ncbi:lipopolysaccharide heptosyltransferase II [Vibrio profundum]|uniref:lipopolysaccharide heptosyltransferase II n=1 Tax=Vibrio profundum TaxID=2910247 RepID=UPI003D0CCD3E
MKILIIGPSWVGDMVMSQSLYSTLKHHYPTSKIDVLAPSWCKPILERMPEVDKAIEMPIGHGSFNLSDRWKIGRNLAKSDYTHAYILPNSAKSALIPLFAGIKNRAGWKGEFRYGLLNDLRKDKKIFQYMVERYVALAYEQTDMITKVTLGNCPIPKLNTSESNIESVVAKLGINNKLPTIGICPGAEFGPAKRWPEKHYAKVVSYAIENGFQVWLFGSNKDIDVCNNILSGLSDTQRNLCYNLAGRTSLVDAVDLLSCCHTVISNDSGLMHVASAVGCNIIAIYGSSSPNYTPPLSHKVAIVDNDVECRPCFQKVCPLGHFDCLEKLEAKKVIAALKGFIANNEISMV